MKNSQSPMLNESPPSGVERKIQAMKGFASILAVVALILSACSREPKRSQQLLVGTWSMTANWQNGDIATTTISIGPDGKYVCQVVGHGRSGTEQTQDMQGTWLVQSGVLIDTETNSSNTNAPLPIVSRAVIVGMDDREMLLRREPNEGITYPTNEPLYRKISK
jgi:hypothetical protein